MNLSKSPVDCIYVTASAHDGRYTRICVASIRYFYPHAMIKVLAGGTLEPRLREELARYWHVGLADVRPGNWGWGFVKLEPLFGPPGQRFLVVDSDTVFAGPVLDVWFGGVADFLIDDEQQTEADTRRLYYDWRKVASIDPAARAPQFVFNSGQWFGTAGVLTRHDFAQVMDWGSIPPRLRHPELFMPGDQGVLNYVLNQKLILDGLTIARRKIMRWPGHGMDGITATTVSKREAPALIVHWAGFKSPRLRSMPGADVLLLFEQLYYAKIPFGCFLRRIRVCRYWLAFNIYQVATRVRLFRRRFRSSPIQLMRREA